MLNCLYEVAKDFQTIIVGVIGFSGVILTLRTNSRLSREHHERSVNHEREVLKKALSGELEIIRRCFSDAATSFEDDNMECGAFFPEKTHTKVYQNFVGKLGLLSVEEVSAVIKAYTLIDEAPIRLRLLTTKHDSSFDKPGYIYLESPHSKNAVGIYKSFLPSIEAALQKLGDS